MRRRISTIAIADAPLAKQNLISQQDLAEDPANQANYKGWDPNEEFYAYKTQLTVYICLLVRNAIPPDGRFDTLRRVWENGLNDDALRARVIDDHRKAANINAR
jgi:hypothetical protein